MGSGIFTSPFGVASHVYVHAWASCPTVPYRTLFFAIFCYAAVCPRLPSRRNKRQVRPSAGGHFRTGVTVTHVCVHVFAVYEAKQGWQR